MNTTCPFCSTSADAEVKFCHKCGTQLRCLSCNQLLQLNAQFCVQCGQEVKTRSSNNDNRKSPNTVNYKKTDQEVAFDIALTDEVAKNGMRDLLTALFTRQSPGRLASPSVPSPPTDAFIEYEEEKTTEVSDPKPPQTNKEPDENAEGNAEMPMLKDVEMTVDCSESEWILIYAFYASKFATETFTKEVVREKYLAKRKTSSRDSNFPREWKKLIGHFIWSVNETDYKIKTDTVPTIKNLIVGQKPEHKNNPKKITRRTKAADVKAEPFNIDANENKTSFKDFVQEKKPKQTKDKILVIGYYITKINNEPLFTDGNIEYAYSAVDLGSRIHHLRQTIINLKNDKSLVREMEANEKKGWVLDRVAEIHVEEKLPANEK